MTWSLGVDPGASGAAVLLGPSGRGVVGWAWVARTRSGRRAYEVAVCQWGRDPRVELVASIHDVGELIARGARAVAGPEARILLGCEDQHVARSARSAIILARSAGEVVGPLRRISDPEVAFIAPSEWRETFSVSGGKDVKERAIAQVGAWIPEAEGLRARAARSLGVALGAVEGVVEAFAIATRRRTWRKQPTRKRSNRSSRRGASGKRTRTSVRSRKGAGT